MDRTYIVVANTGRARFFTVEPDEPLLARPKLVEQKVLVNPHLREAEAAPGRVRTETNTDRQAGPVHPIVAQRARHEFELDRRFAQQIEQHVAEFTRAWTRGRVVLVAEPQLLGLLREALRSGLNPGVELKELAKNYTHMTVAELRDHLALDRLIAAKQVSFE